MVEFPCVVGSLSSVLGALLQTDDTLHGVQSLHLEVIPARQVVKNYWPDHNAAASAIYNAFSSSHLAAPYRYWLQRLVQDRMMSRVSIVRNRRYMAVEDNPIVGYVVQLPPAVCPRVAKNTTSDWYAGVMVVGRIGS